METITDTIAAIATAAGPAGVSVIRISGPEALKIGDHLVATSNNAKRPSQCHAGTFFYARIQNPKTEQRIDDGLFLIFRAPHSFTGEDVLEIHGHGGRIPSEQILQAVFAAGARLAEPGEFSKRAFLNGRLDLTQAEAIMDFIQSKSERMAHIARAQLDGALGSQVLHLYHETTSLCAEIEYLLDFDENELPVDFIRQWKPRLCTVETAIKSLITSWKSNGHVLRDGATVVISGKPNVGKSSLLNALLGHSRAIVNEQPGTTRDTIEEGCVIQGIPIRLVDTAGIRQTSDGIEQEGIARSHHCIAQADVNLRLIESTDLAERAACDEDARSKNDIVVITKGDLCEPHLNNSEKMKAPVVISVKTGQGLETLKHKIIEVLGCTQSESTGTAIVSARHAAELMRAEQALADASPLFEHKNVDCALLAHHLRIAAEALGHITGRIYSEDLLDAVFSRFCVGK